MPYGVAEVQVVLLPGDNPLGGLMEQHGDRGFGAIHVAAAFATEQGVNLMVSMIGEHQSWERAIKRFLIGIDYGTTQPQALRKLQSLPQSEVRVPGFDEVLTSRAFQRQGVFHPKAYSISGKNTEFTLLVGSPNLTRAGLTTNVEAGVIIPGCRLSSDGRDRICRRFSSWWDRLWRNCEVLSEDAIACYEERRSLLRTGSPDLFLMEEPSPTELAGAGSLWIESGFLSGGSRNQLELPNGLEAFFHIPKGLHEAVHEITLEKGEKTWPAQIRFWGNQVWRLRLPTERDGLGNYEKCVIRFVQREAAGRFGIQVSGRDSREFRDWERRSLDIGTVRRTTPGEGGREYGWF